MQNDKQIESLKLSQSDTESEKLRTVKMKAVRLKRAEPKVTVLNVTKVILTKVIWPLSCFGLKFSWKLFWGYVSFLLALTFTAHR